jgi:hypothetical protein
VRAQLMSLEKPREFRHPRIDAWERQGYAAVDDCFASSQESDPSVARALRQLLKGQPNGATAFFGQMAVESLWEAARGRPKARVRSVCSKRVAIHA